MNPDSDEAIFDPELLNELNSDKVHENNVFLPTNTFLG